MIGATTRGIGRDARRRCSLWQTRPRHGSSGTCAVEEVEEEQKGVSFIGGKRGEQRGCTRRHPDSGLGPERVELIRSAKRRGTTPERGISLARTDQASSYRYRNAPALAIVKRKIASVTLGISRISRDHAWVRREARRGNAAGSVPALSFEKRVFSLLEYDGNRCGNIITRRSRLRTSTMTCSSFNKISLL